ncbi:MAG: hypothetical protein ABI231_03195 [Candidatus Tumulicola sp.]
MKAIATESRWPPAVCVLVVLVLAGLTPNRYHAFPTWVPFGAAALFAVALAIGAAFGSDARWRRLERGAMIVVAIIALAANCVNLFVVVRALVFTPDRVHAVELLATSVMIWVSNVVIFAILYWDLDRGGPGARARSEQTYPDFAFPQASDPNLSPPGWQPGFVDYLFLGFTGATAFSPTDALPLTPRAKVLMMAQGLISLVALVVVAARAINIVQ